MIREGGSLRENALNFWVALSELVGGRLDSLVAWFDMMPRNRFVFIIRDTVSEIRHEELTVNEMVTVSLNARTFKGSLAEGWIKPVGRWERFRHKIKEERWVIYEETPEDETPEQINQAVVPVNSAQLLYAVHMFKGVDDGLSDEFKMRTGWDDMPGWIMIVLLGVFIVVAGYVAYTEGIITL